ncbi:ScbR family autoregulator-binding transcription factor [Streptomyces sp. NBC_01239]|uniref:ScbR family autoregulator-binding transcription factor n=1 Tax=Streptomyces sp. NBC_01239 TaxID=2903792 RepID=UPI0022596277|nr:ScbR family autoregulator-binding transcription factor [Streptomyces sp. NBC_01239]MCX4816690.1 ScbR family autoregulator-binding transcription factor [Streptomyces sp. NBC_01239]MCX4818079.1 ScbR family autoregulator-binding transcription factor [Streptomyces sp. NBC_01239]MCX4818269.1 ScbR family autoregulator-binding transcription factor [Streptomyces sp. NBC_01239]
MVKQERAARTRRSLIEAASEVFAEAGFAPASLGAISARAGVSNGALHFHFANKNMLAEAVEAQAAETVARITGAARERQGDSLQAVVDATHDLMDTLARDTVVRAGFQLAADSAARATPPPGPGPRVRWRHWVEDSLRRAGHRGALAPGLSWTDAARVVVAATVGLQVLGATDASWLRRHNVTRLWDVLLPRLASRRDLAALVTSGTRPPATPPRDRPQPPPATR